ncbi:MAG: hypothetical protein ACJ71N_12685 [Terriglobales bacterium]|jgi:hypothetical protein
MRFLRPALLFTFVLFAFAFSARASKKDKPDTSTKMVDSGTFGVFVNGRRVATETFNIQQNGEGSTTTSEFRLQDGSHPPISSDWQLTPTGDLRHYAWKDGTGKSQTSVEPGDQVLHQQILIGGDAKPISREYLLPLSTPILDDYAFVQREILAWRFLATGCQQSPQGLACKEPSQFGVLIPQQQTSLAVTIEFKGMETVDLKGAQKQMGRFNLKAENFEWHLWMDDFKLMRIEIPADHTEIVRD